MRLQTKPTCPSNKMYMDICDAAEISGFSVAGFRRIIEEERIRIVQVGRKFKILSADFERWQTRKKAKID